MIEWLDTTPDHMIEAGKSSQRVLGHDVVEQVIDDPTLIRLLKTHAKTMLVNGDIVLIIGVWPQWAGVASAWALVTPRVFQHGIAVLRGVRRQLNYIIKREGLHRVQALVDAKHTQGIDFVMHYGFTYEGRMRAYTEDGEDVLLFARVSNATTLHGGLSGGARDVHRVGRQVCQESA